MKILLIDDKPEVREVLECILEEEFEVELTEADDGLAGFEAAKKEKYDLIITDYKMPKMDGCDFIETIRKCENPSQYVTILFVSGHMPILKGDAEIWDDVYFIEKPFNHAQILYYTKLKIKKNAA